MPRLLIIAHEDNRGRSWIEIPVMMGLAKLTVRSGDVDELIQALEKLKTKSKKD